MFDVLDVLLDDLDAAIDKVAACESVFDVERLCRLADRVEFLRVRAIGAFDRSGDWQLNGFLSAAAALRVRCRMMTSSRCCGPRPRTSGRSHERRSNG